MGKNPTLFVIEVAIFTGLALVLDLLPFLKFKIWPAGGSISLAMIPVFLLAFRWGLKGGIISGFLWGILQIAVGDAYILNFFQGLIEYGLAFTLLGLAGLFSNKIRSSVINKKRKETFIYITCGVLLGGGLRFVSHFFAGWIFFADLAPEGQSPALYSFLYNSSYMFPSLIICLFVSFLLFSRQAKMFIQQNK